MTKGKDASGARAARFERTKVHGTGVEGDRRPIRISHFERPLKPNKLCSALGAEIETTDLDIDNASSIRTLLLG